MIWAQPGNEVLPGVVSSDPSEWQAEVSAQFSAKWGASQFQNRLNILDAVLRSDGDGFLFSEADVQASFAHIRKQGKLDHYGVSVAAIKLLFLGQAQHSCCILVVCNSIHCYLIILQSPWQSVRRRIPHNSRKIFAFDLAAARCHTVT